MKRAQQLGFSLEEIDALLDLAVGGPSSCDDARAVASARLAQLEQKIAGLTAMRDSLRQLVATCDRSRSGRLCPLIEALDETTEIGEDDA
ncbi:MAG: MerR family DNA-binding protein [Actinomycetota bacterium]